MSKLDPRAKLFFAIACAAMLMITTNAATLSVASIAIMFGVIALKHTRAWINTLRVLLPMTAFFVLVMLWSFDWITALVGALRLLALTTIFFVFFQTTAPEDLANALVASRVPYSFAFILTTAMQFVPVLARKMQDVIDAQRARGIRLERDLASARNYPALFVPLLIQSFTLADQLAEAMEARGFGAPHRTFAKTYKLQRADFLIILLAVILIFAGWQWR